jgi:hypothetical protein
MIAFFQLFSMYATMGLKPAALRSISKSLWPKAYETPNRTRRRSPLIQLSSLMRSLALAAALVAVSGPVRAASEQEVAEAYRDQQAEQTEDLVRSSLAEYFQRIGLPPPDDVRVTTKADVVRAKGKLALRAVAIDVVLVTDHPASVVREARMQLARDLAARGFRFTVDDEAAPATDGVRGDDEIRPYAALKLEAEAPPAVTETWRVELKSALIFGCMVFAALSGFVLAFYMLLRPFLVWRRERRRRRAEPVADATPVVAKREPSVDWSAVPASEPQVNLAEMPFERALEYLKTLDVRTRQAVIDKLQLNASVRRRIEKELAEGPRV